LEEENANMTSFRNMTAVAVGAALVAATPAYAVLIHNALIPKALIEKALAAVGSGIHDLNRIALDGVAVPDGAGGVLMAEDWESRIQ
jgi:hypothetical protein